MPRRYRLCYKNIDRKSDRHSFSDPSIRSINGSTDYALFSGSSALVYTSPSSSAAYPCHCRAWRSTPGSEPQISPPLGSPNYFSAGLSKPDDSKLTFPHQKAAQKTNRICSLDGTLMILQKCMSHAIQRRQSETKKAARLDQDPGIGNISAVNFRIVARIPRKFIEAMHWE